MSADAAAVPRRARRATAASSVPGLLDAGWCDRLAPGDRALPTDAERPLRRAVPPGRPAGRQRPVPLDRRPRPPASSPTTRRSSSWPCALLDEDRVVLVEDQWFSSEPGATTPSPWHQDQPYYRRRPAVPHALGDARRHRRSPARCASSPARTSGRRSPRSSSRRRRARSTPSATLPPPPDIDERVPGGGADVVAARRRRASPSTPGRSTPPGGPRSPGRSGRISTRWASPSHPLRRPPGRHRGVLGPRPARSRRRRPAGVRRLPARRAHASDHEFTDRKQPRPDRVTVQPQC